MSVPIRVSGRGKPVGTLTFIDKNAIRVRIDDERNDEVWFEAVITTDDLERAAAETPELAET